MSHPTDSKKDSKQAKKTTPILKAIWKKLELDTYNTANAMPINELENVVSQANYAYHSTDKDLISDAAFDIIVDILRQKSPSSNVLGQIGSELPADANNKVSLPYYLGSMDKIKPGSRALSIWLDKYKGPFTVSEKLDGLSGLLIIKLKSSDNDELSMRLYTRGTGSIGQDISHLLPFLSPLSSKGRKAIIEHLKKQSSAKNDVHIAIRGEIILSRSKFEDKYVDAYPKARSLVSGLVNAKPKKYKSQVYRNKASDMDFVAYQIIEPVGMTSQKQFEMLEKTWDMLTANNETISKFNDVNHLEEMLVEYKDSSKYEIDGIIVSDNSRVWPQPKSGNPKHSVAFKMELEGQTRDTTVVNVEYNISKQGYLKPRVQFEPVTIGGDTITFATGFNAKFIKDNNLGPGAKIKIIKSGDVIPYIRRVISASSSGKWQEPDVEYKWTDSEVDALVEDPSQMPEYISSRLIYFFDVMNVDGLRQGTVNKLVNAGFDSVNLILSLKAESLVDVDGFKDKSTTKLLKSIKEQLLDKKHPLTQIMAASGCFPGFGRRKIATIVNGLLENMTDVHDDDGSSSGSEAKYIKRLQQELVVKYDKGDKKNVVTIETLSQIPSIAPTTASMFIANLDCFHRWVVANPKLHIQSLSEMVSEKKKLNKKVTPSKESKSMKKLEGVTGAIVLFTGFRDSNLEKRLVDEYGVTMKSTMSNQVTLLVVADANKKNSKMEKAEKLGITIMSRDDLVKKIA